MKVSICGIFQLKKCIHSQNLENLWKSLTHYCNNLKLLHYKFDIFFGKIVLKLFLCSNCWVGNEPFILKFQEFVFPSKILATSPTEFDANKHFKVELSLTLFSEFKHCNCLSFEKRWLLEKICCQSQRFMHITAQQVLLCS